MSFGDILAPQIEASDALTTHLAQAAFYVCSPDDKRSAGFKKVIAAQGGNCTLLTDIDDALREVRQPGNAQKILIVDLIGADMDRFDNIATQLPADVVIVILCDSEKRHNMPEDLLNAAFFVMAGPITMNMFDSVVRSAQNEAVRRVALKNECASHFHVVKRAETAKFQFRTLEDANTLARFLSFAFPNQTTALQGLGELMRNAVEHGNLDIGFKEKARLVEDIKLETEIENRLKNPQYSERVAEAVLARKVEGVYVVITDQGAGFNWREFTKFSPSRAAHKNGRGIQVARLTCFNKLAYNEAGNQVSVFSAFEKKA